MDLWVPDFDLISLQYHFVSILIENLMGMLVLEVPLRNLIESISS